jgi:hypothetical protein
MKTQELFYPVQHLSPAAKEFSQIDKEACFTKTAPQTTKLCNFHCTQSQVQICMIYEEELEIMLNNVVKWEYYFYVYHILTRPEKQIRIN